MPINNIDPPKKKYKIGYDYYMDDPGGIQKPNQPFLVDLVTLEKLFFMGLPNELEMSPDANWVAVAPPGRNLALYQYVGGEDTLILNLSFFGLDISRQDVLRKCKWLHSLTRNDGYDRKPHPVSLYFGDLFRSSKWIVFSAPYKLALFNREFGMLPQLATVELTLKRISEQNMSRNSILKIDT